MPFLLPTNFLWAVGIIGVIAQSKEARLDDKQAIAQIKKKNMQGLAHLVTTYQHQALRAADVITRDVGLAEDIVQGAFIKVFQRIHQYDTSRPFRAWFMKMVVNDALKVVTRRQTMSLDDDQDKIPLGELLPDDDADPFFIISQAEDRMVIEMALDNLPPQLRAVVMLKYFLEYSEEEISATLDEPRSTIKWRLYTARNQLRLALSPFIAEREA
jgi:RNA polymerase sigma-70 factor (ECF subfamily)